MLIYSQVARDLKRTYIKTSLLVCYSVKPMDKNFEKFLLIKDFSIIVPGVLHCIHIMEGNRRQNEQLNFVQSVTKLFWTVASQRTSNPIFKVLLR